MLVRYWMTPDPLTVDEDTDLLRALQIMRRHRITHLPVCRGNKLLGILTVRDLYRHVDPAQLHQEDVAPEVERFLATHAVTQAMTPAPLVTCGLNDPVEDIGIRMGEKKIGGFPVVHGSRLVGIITESDVLRGLSSLTHGSGDGLRMYLRIGDEDRSHLLYQLVDLARSHGIEILALLTHPIRGEGAQLVLVRISGDRIREFTETLWQKGFRLLSMDPIPA